MSIFPQPIMCLTKKYKYLKNDYSIFQDFYNNLLAKKDCYVIEGDKKKLIDSCSELLDRSTVVAANQNSSSENSNKGPAALPSYGA